MTVKCRYDKAKKISIIYKALSILLAVICVFSAAVAGTLALIPTQHKSNQFEGTAPVPVMLVKHERNIDGHFTTVPVKDAQFYLYKVDTPDDIQIGGSLYTTDADGRISMPDVEPGEYYFLETEPGYGYTFDKDKDGKNIEKYTFTVDENQNGKPVFVYAYNQRLSAQLIIEKTVKNADNGSLTEQQKKIEFEFTMSFYNPDGSVNDGTYTYKIDGAGEDISLNSGDIIKLTHDQKAIFANLPVGITYEVTESPALGFVMSGANQSGDLPQGGATAEFINTYYGSTGMLTVTKEVTGSLADIDREFSFTVTFRDSAGNADDGSYPYQINGVDAGTSVNGTVTFKLKHDDVAVFSDLPEGVTYTVVEDDANTDGYTALTDKFTGTTIIGNVNLPFVNHKDTPITNGKLAIEKQVTGYNADKTKGFDFTVTFSDGGSYQYRITGGNASGGGDLQSHTSGDKITLKDGQTAVFENIPVGTTYTVTEDDYLPDGYIATMQEVSGTIAVENPAPIVFENNKQTPQKLLVKKVVAGEVNEQDKDKAFDFTVTIKRDADDVGTEHKFPLKDGEEKSFDLPMNAIYTVKEDDYEDFEVSYSSRSYDTADGHIFEVLCTNTFTGRITTEISVVKTWDMTADPSASLPENITLYLKDGDRIVETKVVIAEDDWKHIFTAAKYRADGVTVIAYTVEEEAVYGFETTVTKTAEGFDIKNTLIPVAVVDPPVTKIVTGRPNTSGRFTFVMEAITPNAPMPHGAVDGKLSMTIVGSATKDFGDIRYDTAGVYEYRVSELDEGLLGYIYDTTVYTMTVTVSKNGNVVQEVTTYKTQDDTPANGLVFTNSYSSPTTEFVTIAGEKIWEHLDNPVSKQPKNITVNILANGQQYMSFALDGESDWRYSFELPKYDAAGNELTYTVQEVNVPNYTVSYDGYNIKNTYKTPDQPDDPNDPNKPEKPGDGPKTSDDSNPMPWVIVMIISAAAFIAVFVIGRKKKYIGKYYA